MAFDLFTTPERILTGDDERERKQEVEVCDRKLTNAIIDGRHQGTCYH